MFVFFMSKVKEARLELSESTLQTVLQHREKLHYSKLLSTGGPGISPPVLHSMMKGILICQ